MDGVGNKHGIVGAVSVVNNNTQASLMKMDAANLEKPIILATETELYNKISGCYEKPVKIILAEELNTLFEILSENIDATLLLDLSLFNDDVDHPMVKAIFKKGVEQRIIVITKEQDPAKLYALLEQGARGFFQSTIRDELLMKAIKVVGEGDLWIGRNMINYLMSEQIIGEIRKSYEASESKISDATLTSRESDIANSIVQGKCNKIIARELGISLSTVKAHLGHIFKKLQVINRVQLALLYQETRLN